MKCCSRAGVLRWTAVWDKWFEKVRTELELMAPLWPRSEWDKLCFSIAQVLLDRQRQDKN